jgi:DNA-binding MarR family transcriptional regulator
MVTDDDAQHIWKILVSLVMGSRGDWRRQATELTGLPFSRVRALRRLAAQEMTLSELAQEMGIDAPATTVIVNDLEARGLVTRRPHPDNRRCKLVAATSEGQERIAVLSQIKDAPPPALAALPGKDLASLRQVLSKLDLG